MQKVEIAQGVADRLFATEASVDQAIADASRLVAELIQARQSLELSVVVGDEALTKVTQAMAIMADARKTVIEAHRSLDETKLRLGIRAKMIGSPDSNDQIALRAEVREMRRAG